MSKLRDSILLNNAIWAGQNKSPKLEWAKAAFKEIKYSCNEDV